jgi:ABC-type antimicrobial peptide transport system permease subunit
MRLSRMRTVLSVNLKLCLLEIVTNRARSFITSLGIFLGVASLLVNLAFVRAMDADVQANLDRIGGLSIITVERVRPETREERMAFQRSPGLTIEELERIAPEFSSIEAVLKYRGLRWKRMTAEGNVSGGFPIALDDRAFQAYNYEIAAGRGLVAADMRQRAPVCVIGKRVAKRLFGDPARAVGKTLTVESIPLTVVGIINTSTEYNRRAMECLFPFSVYKEKIIGARRTVGEVKILLRDPSLAEQARRELTWRLAAAHRGVADFEIEINQDRIKEMRAASRGMQILLWSIALISLIVGGISIMNIMFATIGDRIREIGIRKALGAQKSDIFTKFIIEAVLVCFVGGIPGIALGMAITLVPRGVFPFNPTLSPVEYGVAILFTALAGFCSGLFPALKAANMKPVEALQY